MKNIILRLTVFITPLIASGQVVNNFNVQDGTLIWQKIYETNLSTEDLNSYFSDSGLFGDLKSTDKAISGEIKLIDADFKGAGYKEMTTPIYISRSHFTGFLKIEFKDQKYRVTVKNIKMIQKYSDPLSEKGEIESIETFAVNKKGELKYKFNKAPSKILDYTFLNLFTVKKATDDNW